MLLTKEWENLPVKQIKQIKQTNKSKPTPNKKKPSKSLLSKNIFKQVDIKEKIINLEEKIMIQIFKEPISDEEYDIAFRLACGECGDLDKDEWYAISEAENIVYDKRRINKGLKPVLSETLGEPIIVNLENIKEEIKEENNNEINDTTPLPNAIAIICEWQNEENNWNSEVIAIVKTSKDFWDVVNNLSGNSTGSESRFSLALEGKEAMADNIFKSLISSGKNRHINEDDVVDIDHSSQKKINAIVSRYNALHPVWSFVKVSDDTTLDSKIDVPFIRDKIRKHAINDINVNLKDTKANALHGIRTIDNEFSNGYIPKLVLAFIGGNTPSEIKSLVFSKTIAVNVNTYFKGYRLRILTDSGENKCLKKCKKFIEEDFIKKYSTDNCDYARCVVRISLPK